MSFANSVITLQGGNGARLEASRMAVINICQSGHFFKACSAEYALQSFVVPVGNFLLNG
jgi:hypothetical protein